METIFDLKLQIPLTDVIGGEIRYEEVPARIIKHAHEKDITLFINPDPDGGYDLREYVTGSLCAYDSTQPKLEKKVDELFQKNSVEVWQSFIIKAINKRGIRNQGHNYTWLAVGKTNEKTN